MILTCGSCASNYCEVVDVCMQTSSVRAWRQECSLSAVVALYRQLAERGGPGGLRRDAGIGSFMAWVMRLPIVTLMHGRMEDPLATVMCHLIELLALHCRATYVYVDVHLR